MLGSGSKRPRTAAAAAGGGRKKRGVDVDPKRKGRVAAARKLQYYNRRRLKKSTELNDLKVELVALRDAAASHSVLDEVAPGFAEMAAGRQKKEGQKTRGKASIGSLNPKFYTYRRAIKTLAAGLAAAAGLEKGKPTEAAQVLSSLVEALGCFAAMHRNASASPGGKSFLGDVQLVALKNECRWSYNQLATFISKIKAKVPPTLKAGVGSVSGAKAVVEGMDCPRGRKVAGKHRPILGDAARVTPVLDHTLAVLSDISKQDALLVGFEKFGWVVPVVASNDHLNTTNAHRGLEVCYGYTLLLYSTRHSVDTPITMLADIQEKIHEMHALNEELYFPGQDIL
jgi:hypothetical protein